MKQNEIDLCPTQINLFKCGDEGEELIVSIMSLEGKILEQKQVNYLSGINIPIEKLNSGHYHIIIQHRNQVAFKPFVKK